MKVFYKMALMLGLSAVASLSTEAQNVQLHYDFGRTLYPELQKGRPNVMLTVEQQSPDKFGDTFYFVDMNFKGQGAVAANWKFFRNLKFWDGPWTLHLRYDGGLRFINTNINTDTPRPAVSLKDAFFTGASYTFMTPDRKLLLQGIAAYKYIKKHETPHNWEATFVWKYAPGSGAFSATGFATLWQEKFNWATPGTTPQYTNYRFMAQPQFWLNLNKLKGVSEHCRLSVGTEVRISNNVDAKQFVVMPTLALKWSLGK